ncbi:MAG: hypothetical protein HQM02_01445 [Magnetococcales bacterium]|nr:hypothetical protein [Magnetococcales bacterium]
MRLQEEHFSVGNACQIIRFVPPAQFKQEANELMTTMTHQLQTLKNKGEDPLLTDAISRSMDSFHHMAALRGLKDIAELAMHVARALEQTEPGKNEAAKRVVALSLAAVSQIQCLLNPSVEGAAANARRIVSGLIQQW